MPFCSEPIPVAHGNAVDPLERQHSLGRAPPVDRRHTETRVALDVVGHLGDGGALEPQVELDVHRSLQRFDDGDRAQAAGRWREALDQSRAIGEALDVGREAPLDVRTQDLDGDPSGAASLIDLSGMHLGDRGGRDGRLDLGKVVADRAAKRLLDGALGLAHRKRRQLIAQRGEIVRQVLTNEVGPGGEELTELDVGGTKPRQRLCKPGAVAAVSPESKRQPQDSDRKGRKAGEAQSKRHGRAFWRDPHAVLGQHEAGAGKSKQIADC